LPKRRIVDIDSGFITANYYILKCFFWLRQMSVRKEVKKELNDIRQHISEVRSPKAKDELVRRYAQLLQSLVIEGD